MGEILLQTHNRLATELGTCRELTQKLNEQSAIMTSAVEVARSRKEQVLASRKEVSSHLEDLKNLVAKKEQEVRSS
jgi:hypothetical protein